MPTLQDRFRGCLLGVAIGDALGGLFEARSPESIRERFATADEIAAYPKEEIWYTDDTQMTIGIAETLADHGEIVNIRLCEAFVANYIPSRGYGRGARAILEAMEDGKDHEQVAAEYFPGGSYGNGAAMRVAPVGLFFHHERKRIWEQARLSALPTHLHALGIEGAQILALAVGILCEDAAWNRTRFFDELLAPDLTFEYRTQMEFASRANSVDKLPPLGNRIEALYSVPTAIACFALTPDSLTDTLGNAIFLGGDTDTIAAMAGALVGTHLGLQGLPERLVRLLESSPKGRDYLLALADRLYTTHVQSRNK